MTGIIIEILIGDGDQARWVTDEPAQPVDAVKRAFRLGRNPQIKEIRVKETATS